MKSSKDFIFRRDLKPDVAKEIHYNVKNVLKDAPYFSIYSPEELHISLVHQGMLKNRKTAKNFNLLYSKFDSNRRILSSHTTISPWEVGEVSYSGIEMLKYTMAITTDAPNWLKNERRNIIKISGIHDDQLNFDIDSYNPHISLAYFVGEIRDISHIETVQNKLETHLSYLGKIVLEPLMLSSERENWTF